MMWSWGPNGWSWEGWLLMGLAMLVFWSVVAWGIVSLVRYTASPRPEPRDGDVHRGPQQILDERFARGEIDEDEYLERRKVLQRR